MNKVVEGSINPNNGEMTPTYEGWDPQVIQFSQFIHQTSTANILLGIIDHCSWIKDQMLLNGCSKSLYELYRKNCIKSLIVISPKKFNDRIRKKEAKNGKFNHTVSDYIERERPKMKRFDEFFDEDNPPSIVYDLPSRFMKDPKKYL